MGVSNSHNNLGEAYHFAVEFVAGLDNVEDLSFLL